MNRKEIFFRRWKSSGTSHIWTEFRIFQEYSKKILKFLVYFTKFEIFWETFLEKTTGIWNIFKIFLGIFRGIFFEFRCERCLKELAKEISLIIWFKICIACAIYFFIHGFFFSAASSSPITGSERKGQNQPKTFKL